MGSCFPPSFGGSCSGTPEDCQDCLDVCKEDQGIEITIEVKEGGKFLFISTFHPSFELLMTTKRKSKVLCIVVILTDVGH